MNNMIFRTNSLCEYFQRQPNVFTGVEELEIVEMDSNMLYKSSDLFRKFENIKKFIVRTDNEELNLMLDECLSHMGQLKVIILDTKAEEANERFNIIKAKAPYVEEVYVHRQFAETARLIFDANTRVFIID